MGVVPGGQQVRSSFFGMGEATNLPSLLCRGCLHILTQRMPCQADTPSHRRWGYSSSCAFVF